LQRKPLHVAKNMVTAAGNRHRNGNSNSASNSRSTGGGGVSLYESTKPKIDPMDRFRCNLSRYSRTNDRRMMVRTLKDCSRLRSIPLDPLECAEGLPSTPKEWFELECEVSNAELLVNGITFGPRQISSTTQKDASINNFVANRLPNKEQLSLLLKLCEHMVTQAEASVAQDEEFENTTQLPEPQQLYRRILVRLARTRASQDAFHQLNALVGCADLILQPPKKAQPLPIDLTLYQSNGIIHAVTTTRHPYGLFRKSDLATSHVGSVKRPWIRVLASVNERVNLSTGASVRYCSVEVQEK
jgi:hypothetical protein